MRRGIIYIFVSWLIELLVKLNLVEHFKDLIAWYSPSEHLKTTFKSNAIDIYIFFKWFSLFILPLLNFNQVVTFSIVAYLMFFNIFTYFYHHVWNSKSDGSLQANQRRFITFAQSLAFNIFGFAFLYHHLFKNEFAWKYPELALAPLYFSIATTFAANTDIVSATSARGALIPVIQTLTSFIFLTLILSHTTVTGDKK